MTTALAFEKLGIDYQLFEKAPELNEVGAGIWLAPNALQVFDWLGILDEIQNHGNAIDRITLAEPDFSPISDSFQHEVKRKFGYTTVAIHRAELQKILFQKVPSEKVHLGIPFKKFVRDENGLSVIFEKGKREKTNYLIGADGIHSPVRNQLFPESSLRYSGQTCWRGISDYKIEPYLSHRGLELWGDRIRFGISKVSKGKVYWFAVALSKPQIKDDIDELKNQLSKSYSSFHPLVNRVIMATPKDKILRNDISDLEPIKKWYEGNVCLIGDAAHATTPNMGQGGAQAIEDAYYLANLIKIEGSSRAFNLFQKARQKKVDGIVKQSWFIGKMAHWCRGKTVRNAILRIMPSSIIEKQTIRLYKLKKYDAAVKN